MTESLEGVPGGSCSEFHRPPSQVLVIALQDNPAPPGLWDSEEVARTKWKSSTLSPKFELLRIFDQSVQPLKALKFLFLALPNRGASTTPRLH